ncbi:MAG: hypothetical protein R3236_04390 [Phycisphaeraceae bacterium]|nr:hypothetical protein [Phycisphaeraceae bacterium]
MKNFLKRFGAWTIALTACATQVFGQNGSNEKTIEELLRRVEGLEKKMEQKDRKIRTLEKDHDHEGHDDHQEAHEEHETGYIDVSLEILFAGGTSTARDATIQQLQGGSHDPNRRGFTLQQVALEISGQIGESFRAKAHTVFFIDPEGETGVELEEAFVQTTALPDGFQAEGGFFLTEFGQINPTHPHDWTWLDQPVAHSRIFGADGLRQAGLQLSRRTEHHRWHVGIQQASGETTQSFFANDELYDPAEADRSIGGLAFVEQDPRNFKDFIYSARWACHWQLDEKTVAELGASALYGPNASGPDGRTFIWGVDLKVQAEGPGPGNTGWVWQTEWLMRDFKADPTNPNFITDDLEDWGLYTQLHGWLNEHWALGIRCERAGGSGANSDPSAPGTPISRNTDPFRADRWRLSPLLIWAPNDSSRIRLQYNRDDSEHLSETVHTVWFGFEFALGGHEGH